MEYWWNDSDWVKPNLLGQEILPESHYPPPTPYGVPWPTKREAGNITFGVRAQLDAHLCYRGYFIMFCMITNIYNKKTKGPTLMELFTATGKLKKFFDN
jgi:hypothetical protein